MDKWELIARKMMVLANWGYDMQFFYLHVNEEDFLTETWIKKYYQYIHNDSEVFDELNAIDLLASHDRKTPFRDMEVEEVP